jgi:polygalacturonase
MGWNRITRRDLLKAGLRAAAAAGAAGATEFFGFPLVLSPPPRKPAGSLPWQEARQIVADTAYPTFPDLTVLATDSRYGIVSDGQTDNTAAFRKAIEDCSFRGGGHVVVPAGIYSTGAIHLLSGVDLNLGPGAVLRFSGNAADYPLVLTRYEGIECMNHSPMVYAHGQTNIALTGAGTLDASGTRRWNLGSNRTGILEPLVAAGIPPEQRVIPDHDHLRSAFVEFYRCTNVLVQGVTLRRSQFWQLHPTLCRNVRIESVTTGDTTLPNTDGCNPECCDHVVISNCILDAFDDCIGIKSGRDGDGRRVNTPSQNIVISGCSFQGRAAGVACGSEMTGGIGNVYVHDCKTYGASVRHMLYVKSNTRRGGYAENLNFDSVQADHLSGAWAFAQMDYDAQTGRHRPTFEDWNISRASGDFDPWVFQLRGLDDDHIRTVRVSDSEFTRIFVPLDFSNNVDDIRFDRVKINGTQVRS